MRGRGTRPSCADPQADPDAWTVTSTSHSFFAQDTCSGVGGVPYDYTAANTPDAGPGSQIHVIFNTTAWEYVFTLQ